MRTASTPTTKLLHLTGVSKTFWSGEQETPALSQLDLGIQEGEFISLLGPSGCGKSTALSIMGGLLDPSTGSVTMNAEPLDGPRRDIGMMFQKAVMLPWRNTLQNVLLPVEVFGWSRKDYEAKAHELLEMVDIHEFADSYPWQLSGGMQQRAALCRVLVHDPRLLLLDEPFGALDDFTRESIDLEVLRLVAKTGTSAVLVTHNITEAVFMSDRVAIMTSRPGRLVGILDVPFERPREPELMRTPEFSDVVFEARAMLGLQ